MKRSYLIQRLQKPIKGTEAVNPFTFGCGPKNGGLSKDGMKAIENVFRFDYMGSSEFEWGSVPRALNTIWYNHKCYIAFSIDITYACEDWTGKRKKILKGKAPVYVICRPKWREDVIKFIKSKATHPFSKNYPVKECVLLDLSMAKPTDRRSCGWLEISNGYFFFTDEKMYKKTCELFGIKEEK